MLSSHTFECVKNLFFVPPFLFAYYIWHSNKCMSKLVKKFSPYLPHAVFLLFFLCGIIAYQDYGIGWDDEFARVLTGRVNLNYITNLDKTTLLYVAEKYHGPFFEILLASIERGLKMTDTASIYKMRHLVQFLVFFMAVIAFYKTAIKIVGKQYALMACLFLVLSPRLFAESFYNSKDLAFLSFFIFSFYSFVQFFEKRNWLWAIVHGILTAFLIDIRILGILMPLLTCSYWIVLTFNNTIQKKEILKLLLYLCISIAFVILCWPILWEGPICHFKQAFLEMKKYNWDCGVLYAGHRIPATKLPWHYLILWILISTPLLYLFLFFIGTGQFIQSSFKNGLTSFLQNTNINSVVALFFVPLITIIAMKSIVYDGWRHVYFIYPMFILIATLGLKALWIWSKKWKWGTRIVSSLVAINLLSISFWMIKNHPFQNTFFNELTLITTHDMPHRFELDYWGLSYKQAEEYLLKTTPKDAKIKIAVANYPGELNLLTHAKADRERFKLYPRDSLGYDYFISNFRFEEPPTDLQVVKLFMVDNYPIIGIYKPH